jgi:hypothetical protein
MRAALATLTVIAPLAGGLGWGYDLSGVARGHALDDPRGNGVVYDSDVYPWKKDWDRHVSLAAARHPVLVGEFGADQGDAKGFVARVMAYADRHDLHWAAWSLHPGATPCLIPDWQYTPTVAGEAVIRGLRAAAGKR